jgi:hypothetical protein
LEIPAAAAAAVFTRFLRFVFVARPKDAVGGLGGMFGLRGSWTTVERELQLFV